MGIEGFTSPRIEEQSKRSSQENLYFSPKYEAIEELEHIDEAVLREIFNEIRTKANAQGENTFHPLSKIKIDTTIPLLGIHDKDDIKINTDILSEQPYKHSIEAYRAILLQVIIHEETHASAKNEDCNGSVKGKLTKIISDIKDKEVVLETAGFQKTIYKKNIHNLPSFDPKTSPSERVEFHSLNEGMTEKIARQIFDVYLERTGDKKRYTDPDGAIVSLSLYQNEVTFVDAFTEALSYVCELPKDTVWGGLMSAYMNGISLAKPEFEEFFTTTFGEIFTKDLRDKIALSPELLRTHLSQIQISREQKKALTVTLEEMSKKKD